MQWRVYMDSCCFNRPFDDLSDAMVYMESEAVLAIIDLQERGNSVICGSDVLVDELNRITDKIRFEKVMALYTSSTSNSIELCESIINRASELIKESVKPLDALHVASAEYEEVDVFLSTDKKLLNASKRLDFHVRAYNPAVWLLEVLQDEQQS